MPRDDLHSDHYLTVEQNLLDDCDGSFDYELIQ